MSLNASTLLSRDFFKEYFVAGSKKESEIRVGVEWEKIGIDRESGQAIPYNGPRGVRTIFDALIKRHQWEPVLSHAGNPIALQKNATGITLEPGGQIELSGQKARFLRENASELFQHLEEIREASEPLGIVWLGIGAQPFSRHEDIEWVPKERYHIMRESLRGRGAQTYAMMKETASVQVSLDYTSEKDAIEKMRLAMALSPVLVALFANSPLEQGRRSRYLCRRAHIWSETDPERTGILWDVFEPGFSFEHYISYALNVPVLFIQRNGEWLGLPHMRFEDFWKNGWKNYEAEPADWELHLTSIFTEARLKKYIEIRSMDCQSAPVGLAAVALLKGLFYSEQARKNAWKLLSGLSIPERKKLQQEAALTALRTRFQDGTLLDAAKKLFEMAQAALDGEEKAFLSPLVEILETGQCPAEKLLACYSDTADLRSQAAQVIRCAGIGSGS